jgi:hypothetical protein
MISSAEIWNLVIGTVTGLGASLVFVLALFIGFCTLFGFSKLRPTSRKTLVIKSLDERVGQEAFARYLPATAPRGQVDQLRTPELLEAAARRV